MTQATVRILFIEDDEEDYLVTRELLSEVADDRFELIWVDHADEALERLMLEAFDVCLLDYRVGARTGLDIVHEAAAMGCAVPMIVLTGAGSEEIDHEVMRAGVAYYLDKVGLTSARLERAIRYALNQQHRPTADGGSIVPAVVTPDATPAGGSGDIFDAPRVLLIEDDEDDYILTEELLIDIFGQKAQLDWAQSWEAAMETIGQARHDVYLVDYRLGERNGLELVKEAINHGCSAPFILLTGQGNREIDLEAMRAGVADYLVKGEISAPLLDRAIRYSIERNRAEKRLAELAQYDQLTGLANRFWFREYLAKTMARADRMSRMVAVMLLDLDRFKVINDTHGHKAGDMLLIHISQRLKRCVRRTDLVARLGGDEFTVIMDGITDPNVIAHFANRILDAVKQPVSLGSFQVYTDASIGIAVYPTDARDIDELVASADAAMYRAKEQGAGRFHFYTMAMRIRAAKRLELESGLRGALERHELRLHYQPQVDLRTGRICGMEALVRWQHPQRGLIGPNEFIHLAEESGLIVPVGEWVLHTACAQLQAWHADGLPKVPVAVNFSARQFQLEDLAPLVGAILDTYGLATEYLEIEITESDILKHPERVETLLKEFAEMGVQVALDDFGTGYSSLNHLRSFPGASIKIDQSFIRDVCIEPSDAAIVRSVITMAHHLNLKVIAEGVETHEQLTFLCEHECDIIQGYIASRALETSAITRDVFLRPLIPTLANRFWGLARTEHAPGPSDFPGVATPADCTSDAAARS